jgi:hypothetical protein
MVESLAEGRRPGNVAVVPSKGRKSGAKPAPKGKKRGAKRPRAAVIGR